MDIFIALQLRLFLKGRLDTYFAKGAMGYPPFESSSRVEKGFRCKALLIPMPAPASV
jgi:hypothetical protein